jgi:hypothetical protein
MEAVKFTELADVFETWMLRTIVFVDAGTVYLVAAAFDTAAGPASLFGVRAIYFTSSL